LRALSSMQTRLKARSHLCIELWSSLQPPPRSRDYVLMAGSNEKSRSNNVGPDEPVQCRLMFFTTVVRSDHTNEQLEIHVGAECRHDIGRPSSRRAFQTLTVNSITA